MKYRNLTVKSAAENLETKAMELLEKTIDYAVDVMIAAHASMPLALIRELGISLDEAMSMMYGDGKMEAELVWKIRAYCETELKKEANEG